MNQYYNRSLTPFVEISNDIERMFDSLLGKTVGPAQRANGAENFTPYLDIMETANEYRISVDLPGVKPEDVNVEMEDGRLSISGKRETIAEDNSVNLHRVERTKGSFNRVISLPREVDTDRIEAKYERGVLHVTLPKLAEKQPRKIEIRAQS